MDLPATGVDASSQTATQNWDPLVVLASPLALDAIRRLGESLRSARFINRFGVLQVDDADSRSLVELALGRTVPGDVAVPVLGGEAATRALVMSGGAHWNTDDEVTLAFEVLSDGHTLALLPHLPLGATAGRDVVYAGADTWLLRDQAWRFGLRGRRAAELGTGTGLVAAFLTARFDEVHASDSNPRAVATARLGRELLDSRARARLHVRVGDVASGMEPNSFDFVAVNAPWVPSERAKGRVYADGGATGFELPHRFLVEGVSLLAPGGILVVVCADLEFVDGRRPLRAALDELGGQGFDTSVEPTPIGHPFHHAARSGGDVIAGLSFARHVSAVVRRRR